MWAGAVTMTNNSEPVDWGFGTAVSADGTVVGGHASTASSGVTAFRWTEATGIVTVGPGDQAVMNGNGSTIVGRDSSPSDGTHLYRWTLASGKADLGSFGSFASVSALSADGATIYAGSWDGASGTLYAVDATTLTVKWSLGLGSAGNFKGFIWEDTVNAGRLYFSNGSEIRCVQDFGASGSACPGWTLTPVTAASTPLLLDKIYVGSSDGRLHQIDPATGVDEKQFPAATTLDGTQVGDVTTETGNEVFVGTLAGKLYKIPLPLP